MVQYGAIDHMPPYNLSRGVVLFFPNGTIHVVPPLILHHNTEMATELYTLAYHYSTDPAPRVLVTPPHLSNKHTLTLLLMLPRLLHSSFLWHGDPLSVGQEL